MSATVSAREPGSGRVDARAALRDWNARFLAAEAAVGRDGVRQHLVRGLVYEGIGLIAYAEKSGVPEPEIRQEISQARSAFRASPLMQRVQDWPRGYPGDFETIEYLCGQENRAPAGTLGWHVEATVLASPMVQQHRNKVIRQAQLVAAAVARNPAARILVVACGGAPDLRLVLPQLERSFCRPVLNDIDPDALEFARGQLGAIGKRAEYVAGNVLRCGSRLADRGPYDLILCGGLFDYLTDRHVVHLLRKWVPGMLSPDAPGGGTLFFTNVTRPNPYRPLCGYFADWRLIERTPADFLRLLDEAGVPREWMSAAPDPTGVTWLVQVTPR